MAERAAVYGDIHPAPDILVVGVYFLDVLCV
jgi:hypothetical protein